MTIVEFFGGMLHAQYIASIPIPVTEDFSGKTIVVTGSNQGLGLEAVRHFVRLGSAKVIVACRNLEKGAQAKADIIKTHPEAVEVVEVRQLDLSSYDSVKAFAKAAESLDRVDVLVNNAGISVSSRFEIVEEDESTITTNVVSTYLLCLLMLPKLRETAEKYGTKSHLVVVSSDTHYMAPLAERKADRIFDELANPTKPDMQMRYPNSKLLEILATREIVNRHAPAGGPVIWNLVTPGFCHSSLMRDSSQLGMRAMKFVLNARTTECGSRTLVHAAMAGPESHGEFLNNCKVTAPSSFVLSEEGAKTQARVWDELSEKLERIQPGILSVF